MNKKKDIIILYHAKCRDGFSAAWAVWRKFKDTAEYVGLEHHLPLPESLKDKTLYFLDYAPHENEMKKLLAENERVVVIDHHVSQEGVTKMASEYVYDLNHSGAVLAWNYFHPGKKVPKFLLHVEDGDSWKFKMPGTREIFLATENEPQDFKTWDRLIRDVENAMKRKKYIEHGKAILGYEAALIERIMEDAESVLFEGIKAQVDVIMLDNMDIKRIKDSILFIKAATLWARLFWRQ